MVTVVLVGDLHIFGTTRWGEKKSWGLIFSHVNTAMER